MPKSDVHWSFVDSSLVIAGLCGLIPRVPLVGARALLAVAVLALAGCQFQSQPSAAAPAVTGFELDPCAERLDGLCEQLFRYYAVHRELPETLAALFASSSQPASAEAGLATATPRQAGPPRLKTALTCPKCGKPYVYDRQGVELMGWDGWMIVYDAQPCHDGARYGIVIGPVRPGQPLHLRAERIRESAIIWPVHLP